MNDPASQKPIGLADHMAALKLYVDLANSEKQAIWTRHATMLVGNTLLVNAAARSDVPEFINVAGLVLCFVWFAMTWNGWGWFYKMMEDGRALPIDASLNPFAKIPNLSERRSDMIFVCAVVVIAIFGSVYVAGLWQLVKSNGWGQAVNICTVKSWSEVAVALLALGAAGWWFAASWIGRGSFLQTIIAEFDRILRLQARYNAIAAACAGLAALLQLAIAYMPVCRAFG